MFPAPAQLKLQRYPKTPDRTLKAWNAADELLIDFLQQTLQNKQQSSLSTQALNATLIINDQFGALSTCLNSLAPRYWTDSYLSASAIQQNLRQNLAASVSAQPLHFKLNKDSKHLSFIDLPENLRFNQLVIRIPKHHSLLALQLEQIKPLLAHDVNIVAAGMTKDIHNKTLKIFENSLGPTTTSLAKKKARLVFTQWQNQRQAAIGLKRYSLKRDAITIVSLPGVFSRDQLDIGTRVLLDYLPDLKVNQNLIDLGCGNGVIGAIMAKRQPSANILLTDESALAVASAKLTFAENQLNNGQFIQTDVLQGVNENQYDHVLCNPPFHQQNVQILTIAQNMFHQAAQKLTAEGELRVVANRHLAYAPLLKKYFKQVQSISADSKFTVWLATSPKKP